MKLFKLPLEKRYMTQPFGVDPLTYGRFGMKGHNGWDMRAPTGTPVYAVCDGIVTKEVDSGYGINIRLETETNREGEFLEIVYGHLKEVTKQGAVKAGEQIAISNNTGFSTGSHLHFGVRRRRVQGSGSQVLNYGNGFFGYYDPIIHYPKDVWYRVGREFKLPVDGGYGEPKHMGELKWFIHNAWHFKYFRRLFSDRQKKALRHGYWGVRDVMDETMHGTWTQITKPEHLKRIGKL